MAKRLINLREGIFRYIQQSAQPHYGPGYYVVWSSCHKPQKVRKTTIQSPGTTFAMEVPVKTKFVKKFKFIKPCRGAEE